MLFPSLVALLSLSQAGAPAISYSFDSPVTELSSEWLSHPAFAYLGGKPGEFVKPFRVGFDWTSVVGGRTAADPLDLKVQFVIFERTYRFQPLGKDQGTDLVRGYVERVTKQRMASAIARLGVLVNQWSDGAVRLRPVVRYEPDPVLVSDLKGTAAEYLSTHINGGSFDAEDSVERGPYQSAIVLVPTPFEGSCSGEVNRTPFSVLSLPLIGSEAGGSLLEKNLFLQIYEHLVLKTQADGLRGVLNSDAPSKVPGLPSLQRLVAPTGDLGVLKAGVDADPMAIVAALKLPRTSGTTLPDLDAGLTSPVLGGYKLESEKDAEKGDSLKVTEAAMFRHGAVALPRPVGGFGPAAKDAEVFTFDFKTKNNDPVAIRFVMSNGRVQEEVIGPSVRPEMIYTAPADGMWHSVTLALGLKSKGDVLDRIEIGTPSYLVGRARIDMGGLRWSFANMKFGKGAVALVPTGIQEALFRVSSAAGQGDSAGLASLISGGDPLVRINALLGLAKLKLTKIPLELEKAVNDIDFVISELAIRAIAQQDPALSTPILKRALRICPTEHGRVIAIEALAKTKDLTLIPEFAAMVARPSREVRIAGIKALATYDADNAKIFRLSASVQEDPEIRLTALAEADPDDLEFARRKLLYLAINDTSDAVRIFCYQRLLKSKDSATRTEGLRGIRDDSAWVRLNVVQSIAGVVAEAEGRPALQQAVIDLVPSVRAAAVKGLGSYGTIKVGEVQNLLADDHPTVQLALIAEVDAGHLKVSTETINRWKQASDPLVRAKAEALK